MCFSLSFIKSMSWNRIQLFVHPPSRNSVQPNWKQIALPSITGAGCGVQCMLQCAIYRLMWNSIAQSVTLPANIQHGLTAAFIHCGWHHLPLRRINDYLSLSPCQATNLSSDSNTFIRDFPQETSAWIVSVASWIHQQASSAQQTTLRCCALFIDAVTLSHMPHSISSMSALNRFHFSDLKQRAPQSKQGVKVSRTSSKLQPFWSHSIGLPIRETDPVTSGRNVSRAHSLAQSCCGGV